MSLPYRYFLFTVALIVQSSGIALVVKSLLGTSPISSFPYVLSIISPYTLGQMTFAFNMLLVAGQIALLRREFKRLQLLQIPFTLFFAYSIDTFMALWHWVVPFNYLTQLLPIFIGTAFVSFGVAMQGIANVLMLPGEGIVYAIARKYKFDFAKVKTSNDVLLVLLAAITSWLDLGTIEGIREGTLISALITGTIARFFLRHLSRVDDSGQLIFDPHWR